MKTTVPKYSRTSRDGRTNVWSIECPNCGEIFTPITTVLNRQSMDCPGKHCDAIMVADYNNDIVELISATRH